MPPKSSQSSHFSPMKGRRMSVLKAIKLLQKRVKSDESLLEFCRRHITSEELSRSGWRKTTPDSWLEFVCPPYQQQLVDDYVEHWSRTFIFNVKSWGHRNFISKCATTRQARASRPSHLGNEHGTTTYSDENDYWVSVGSPLFHVNHGAFKWLRNICCDLIS